LLSDASTGLIFKGTWRQGKLEGKTEVVETGGKVYQNPADRIALEIEEMGRTGGMGRLKNIKEAFVLPDRYR
jgi:hypothetical protein